MSFLKKGIKPFYECDHPACDEITNLDGFAEPPATKWHHTLSSDPTAITQYYCPNHVEYGMWFHSTDERVKLL